MTLTNSQYEALEALKSGHNVFLTGEAGTGKSFLLDYFVTNYLADKLSENEVHEDDLNAITEKLLSAL